MGVTEERNITLSLCPRAKGKQFVLLCEYASHNWPKESQKKPHPRVRAAAEKLVEIHLESPLNRVKIASVHSELTAEQGGGVDMGLLKAAYSQRVIDSVTEGRLGLIRSLACTGESDRGPGKPCSQCVVFSLKHAGPSTLQLKALKTRQRRATSSRAAVLAFFALTWNEEVKPEEIETAKKNKQPLPKYSPWVDLLSSPDECRKYLYTKVDGIANNKSMSAAYETTARRALLTHDWKDLAAKVEDLHGQRVLRDAFEQLCQAGCVGQTFGRVASYLLRGDLSEDNPVLYSFICLAAQVGQREFFKWMGMES